MKKVLTTLIAALTVLMAMSQELPQFTSDNFDGWSYNNPGIGLTSVNIGGGKIVLYVNSQGLALTLCSPLFSCQGMDSIEANVVWFTKEFSASNFDISRTALTMVLEDDQGNPLDSVTQVPTVVRSTHTLILRLPVPPGLQTAGLRFVSWTGNVVSSGAIKRALLYAINSSTPGGDTPTSVVGDVDSDGACTIGDVTALVDALLNGSYDGINREGADVDKDGNITIGDVTALIDRLLGGN